MSNSKMSAKDRIDYLLDDHSFVELGGYISARNTDYNLNAKKVKGDGVITGYGTLNGRMVYVYSQDAAALGGSVGEMHAVKIARLYDMAMETGAPIIGMLDCAGLRLQEAYDALHAFGTIFRKQALASGVIPQICAVFGMCGGGCAVMSSLADFTLMEKEAGSLFINSPNTFEGNTESKVNSASAQFQAGKAGTVDFVCEGEENLLDTVRNLVDFLPSDLASDDAWLETEDSLNRIIPELNEAAYDAEFILRSISDDHLFLETGKEYAPEILTGLIRLNGDTVGTIANRPGEDEAVLGYKGLSKARKFIRFLDAFSIPILTITNVTGFRTNLHEERRLGKASAEFASALAACTVPRINLIAGKAYGTAAVLMNSRALGADFVLAWPDASVGMMDAGQAVRIIYGDELAASDDKRAFLAEKTAAYEEMQSSALAAAARGYVDDVIEPDATRKRLIAAFQMLFGKRGKMPERKHPAL